MFCFHILRCPSNFLDCWLISLASSELKVTSPGNKKRIYDYNQLHSLHKAIQNLMKNSPIKKDIFHTCSARNMRWIHIRGFLVFIVKKVRLYKQCSPRPWQAKCSLANFLALRSVKKRKYENGNPLFISFREGKFSFYLQLYIWQGVESGQRRFPCSFWFYPDVFRKNVVLCLSLGRARTHLFSEENITNLSQATE